MPTQEELPPLLRPELVTPPVPFIPVRGQAGGAIWELSPEEAKARNRLQDCLGDLKGEAGSLCAAVMLYEEVSGLPRSSVEVKMSGRELRFPWQMIAAEHGAISLRNWKDAQLTIATQIGKLPTLAPDIDAAAIKDAGKEFDVLVPRAEKLRHATAHPEYYSNPAIDMTGPKGGLPGWKGGANIALRPSLMGNVYVATINGLTVKYEVTADTARAVVDLTRRIFNAFAALVPNR